MTSLTIGETRGFPSANSDGSGEPAAPATAICVSHGRDRAVAAGATGRGVGLAVGASVGARVGAGVGAGGGGRVGAGGGGNAGFGFATGVARWGGTGTGVGVGEGAATPARTRGRSRTTASSVGSGVGWRMAPRSAVVARGPLPQAAHRTAAAATAVAKMRRRRQSGMRG